MSIANPDIIFLGGLSQFPVTETAADVQLTTPEPKPKQEADPKVVFFGIGAVVGLALGIIGTYMTVKR